MVTRISKEIKEKIINEYLNTKRPIKSIAKENGLSIEEIISILQEYQDLQSKELRRDRKKEITDEEKGKKEPKVEKKNPKNNLQITDEEIYEQRQRRLSYKTIAKYFRKQGKMITWISIRKKCKDIYKEKGEEEPRIEEERKYQGITDEEIYELREKGLSYVAIANYFTNQGKKISYQTIRGRCKEICERMETDDIHRKTPARDESSLREQILKLKETKRATDAQISKIAELYGITLTENNCELHTNKNDSNGER